MKTWTKIAIGVGVLAIGLMVVFIKEFQEVKREMAVDSMIMQTQKSNESNSATTGTEENKETSGIVSNGNFTNSFFSYEGKVIEYKPDSITIEVPIDGKNSFSINADTFIKENDGIALTIGSFVDIDANGDIAYKIETDRVIEGMAIVKNVEQSSITLERNGKQMTFPKAAQFYIDTDGNNGSIVGFPAEYTITNDNQIISLEVENDYDYDD